MEEWEHSSTCIDLGTRWNWLVSFILRPHYPRAESLYQWDRMLGAPQRPTERCLLDTEISILRNLVQGLTVCAMPCCVPLPEYKFSLQVTKSNQAMSRSCNECLHQTLHIPEQFQLNPYSDWLEDKLPRFDSRGVKTFISPRLRP
jgi:hypothetical protein